MFINIDLYLSPSKMMSVKLMFHFTPFTYVRLTHIGIYRESQLFVLEDSQIIIGLTFTNQMGLMKMCFMHHTSFIFGKNIYSSIP